ncbi:MAG TPA: hypothetical protein VFN10_22830 [Thermoanaerobaculia bacterium]|nr:hypothetical protein [Thermoanaerobaculia bacterium]
MTILDDVLLSPDIIAERRAKTAVSRNVIFGLSALYGLSTHSIPMPLNEYESIDSGQVSLMLDAEAPPHQNLGIVDFEQFKLKVRYGVQAVFPGLYRLITSGRHDPSLLNPIRATATDECNVTETYSGWRALGCMEFLPGSLWSGAHGG